MGLTHCPHTAHAPYTTPAPLRPLPLTPLTPPLVHLLARRALDDNSLSGSLPTQLGALTALTGYL